MSRFILGLGISGRSAAEVLLRESPVVYGIDKNALFLQKDVEIQHLIQKGLCLMDESGPFFFSKSSQIIVSPGIDPTHPLLNEARSAGAEVVGEVEFAFRYLSNRSFAITGTNGKTTTALLAAHVLQIVGIRARAVGNVGTSLTSCVLKGDPEELLIVELSSFQIDSLKSSPFEMGILLNISPDHLDWHKTFSQYVASKLRLQFHLKEEENFFVSSQIEQDFRPHLTKYQVFDREREPIFLKNFFTSPVAAPVQSIRAVEMLRNFYEISDSLWDRAISTFQRPPHRVEYLGKWQGISFYNDSKATNVESVMYAVSLFTHPVILLAGGVDKGSSYCPWIQAFGSKVKLLVAFGESALKMELELRSSLCFVRVSTLDEAFLVAMAGARQGDCVLLSPGCSSFDQFRNYEHRGYEFKRLVEEKLWIEERRS